MSYIKLAEKVKKFISENDTESAAKLMVKALREPGVQHSVIIQSASQYGLQRNILDGTIKWEEADLARNTINQKLLMIANDLARKEMQKTTVFISYNRKDASKTLAKHIHDEIEACGFDAFMDVEDIPMGADWVDSILGALNSCKYFLLLLSENANHSEMVIKEVEEAHKIRASTGYPIILPIRVQFPINKMLNPRLHGLLFRIHQLEWRNDMDNSRIMGNILDILYQRKELAVNKRISITKSRTLFIKGQEEEERPSPVAPLEVPRGAIPLESVYYIKRPYEDEFIQGVEHSGAVLRVKGPRQYGKTSMLTRVVAHASKLGYTIIAIDFSELSQNSMKDLNELLWDFCNFFAEELELEAELNERWKGLSRKKQITTSFIEKEILRKQDQPILLALDEADRLFSYPEVSQEFFMLLRSWHERSRLPNKKEWEKFRLCLSYSTEAKLAIKDMNASPFNVGEEAHLEPFTRTQVQDLALRHGLSWNGEELNSIMELLGGQPYLVRRAMYLLAKREYAFKELILNSSKHNGPFSDHLRHHLLNLRQVPECAEAMSDILNIQRCHDPLMATRLESTGLVVGAPPVVKPSNGLYASYFKGKL